MCVDQQANSLSYTNVAECPQALYEKTCFWMPWRLGALASGLSFAEVSMYIGKTEARLQTLEAIYIATEPLLFSSIPNHPHPFQSLFARPRSLVLAYIEPVSRLTDLASFYYDYSYVNRDHVLVRISSTFSRIQSCILSTSSDCTHCSFEL